jgi:hypothetical protein
METLFNATTLTRSLETVMSNRTTTVGHRISRHVVKNIKKEPVAQLRIEHKLIIVFAVILMVVFIAYFILTLYEYCLRNEAHEHAHLVYYGEGSTVNVRLQNSFHIL